MEHTTPSAKAAPAHTGLFASTVAELHRGDLLDTLDDELRDLVAACRETGKKGTLTLTLAVAVREQGSDQVSVAAVTKLSAPKASRAESLFYADGARLVREDPRQTRLELITPETRDPEPLRRAS